MHIKVEVFFALISIKFAIVPFCVPSEWMGMIMMTLMTLQVFNLYSANFEEKKTKNKSNQPLKKQNKKEH